MVDKVMTVFTNLLDAEGDQFWSESKILINIRNLADTQRPQDAPLWSYFGRDVLDHNRTKIGRITSFSLFWVCNVWDKLGIRKYKKFL